MLKNRKIGFIGVGNMGQAMIRALVESGAVSPQNLYATNRSSGKLSKMKEFFEIQALENNEELIDICDIIIIAIKPQDLTQVLEPLASSFHSGHLVISIAAGYTLHSLRKLLPEAGGIARAMPNTPVHIRQGVVGYCLEDESSEYEGTVEDILSPLGVVVPAEEGEAFEALTVSCGSGPGFIFELMQYWQEWIEEHGFDSKTAREMVVQTFLGAANLADINRETSIGDLQERVVSKKGVTAAGLQSMRELEIERALRYSFEKAALRDQEIARGTAKQ